MPLNRGLSIDRRACWLGNSLGVLLRVVFVLAVSVGSHAHASPEVNFSSFDAPNGQAVMLKAFWFPALEQAAPSARPAVVLLHGCGGPYNGRGALSERTRDYTALLNGLGLHVLVLDSLTPRGERELCTQKIAARQITMLHRRSDALAAVAWLAQQPQVDAQKIGLMGWSNGGSAVLASTNERHTAVASAVVKPSFAVAFYPGCDAELKRGYLPSARLLMLVGEADDWTPAAPCKRLAQVNGVEIEAYPGAFHGFDSTAPLRVRTDVPNGVNPGRGVTVGGDANALAASRERLLRFLSGL